MFDKDKSFEEVLAEAKPAISNPFTGFNLFGGAQNNQQRSFFNFNPRPPIPVVQ